MAEDGAEDEEDEDGNRGCVEHVGCVFVESGVKENEAGRGAFARACVYGDVVLIRMRSWRRRGKFSLGVCMDMWA